jgi:1,5-anhydro-D-fructose reductase (1,5-anhydro-D-mannitol-forming)
MGQRMLGTMHRYAGFQAAVAWDPDEAARALTAKRFPKLQIASCAEEAIETDATSAVYIACPPAHHEAHARAAFDASKHVWCEKPLGVDITTSEALTDYATRSGQVNIVNFSLASAIATGEIELLLEADYFGELQGVELRVHFASWPREWQADAAGWLAYRDEGGYTREVVSHWVYLTQRLFGSVTLDKAFARYPGNNLSETHLHAIADVKGVPFSIAGSAGGTGPDLVEYTIWGDRASCRIVDWNRFYTSKGGPWHAEREDVADPREAGYERQLTNASSAFADLPHSMPSFADALAVQRIIEAML